MYLLDANVLIDASRDYYPLDRVPQFWDWLVEAGVAELIKIPDTIYREILEGNDELRAWAADPEVQRALRLSEDAALSLVGTVVDRGYADDLTDIEIENLGRDPFLVAHALLNTRRTVVTTEVSKPGRIRANRHLPDVCREMGVRCINTFGLIRELDFRIDA